MFNKFRRSLKAEKKQANRISLPVQPPTPTYCHACGQRTPNQGTFQSMPYYSTTSQPSWPPSPSYEADSHSSTFAGSQNYHSSDASSSGTLELGDGHSITSTTFSAPARRPSTTYSASIYTLEEPDLDDRDEHDDRIHPLPVMVTDCEELSAAFDLPPRTLSNYSDTQHWRRPSKSRYAKLNEMPVTSPRAMMFGDDDLYAGDGMDAGIERAPSVKESKLGRWGSRKGAHKRASLSVATLPSQIRRLSMGSVRKESRQPSED